MPQFRKRPIVVEAVELTREVEVFSPAGAIRGRIGDWLVTGLRNEQYIVAKELFKDLYVPIPDGPEA